jgi:hypothetical protein
MFNHKYRYFFILGLAVYTYLNTVLCEVYRYFNIEIEWYQAFATIIITTICIWEGSRLLEPLFKKIIARQYAYHYYYGGYCFFCKHGAAQLHF